MNDAIDISSPAQGPCESVAKPFSPSFVVPLGDLSALSGYAANRQTEIRVLLPILARVHALIGAHKLSQACVIVAGGSRHLMRGLAPSSLRRKYETYIEAQGDWRALVGKYKGPNQQPDDFKKEVKKAADLNRCSIGEAYRQLRERWAAGEEIAGYGTWYAYYQTLYPERSLPKVWPRGFFPLGWSPRNLRRYGPKKGGRMLYQRGLAAAKPYFPSVRRDTSQLRPLELIVIDDFELDCLCVFPGDGQHKPQIGRVAGLLAMDVGTRRKLHHGLGQRLERHEYAPDGTVRTVRTGIARVDVQMLIHGLFAKWGLPDYPVTILCENAAAAISPELELSIEMLFGGQVRIERTGLINHRNLTNGFLEKGGKPWLKGWIEATFAKLWNILGAQKGYKGNNQRINGPGDLNSKIACTKVLIGQGDRQLNLPPEVIAELKTPFNNIGAMEAAFDWACALSDSRDDHNYVGFQRVTEFLLEESGDPQPLAQLALLSPDEQTQVQVIERMETSIERWQRLCQGIAFTRIKPEVLAVFLLTPKKVTYKNSAITFTLKGSSQRSEGFSYVDRDGTVLAGIQEGTEFLCYFDRNVPEVLHIAQLNGARTGTLTRLGGKRGMVDIRDKKAQAEAAEIQATIINRQLAENRELHSDENDRLGEDRDHNAKVVAAYQATTAGLTKGQKIGLAAGAAAQAQHEAAREAKAVERTLAKAEAALTDQDRRDFLAAETAEPRPAPTGAKLSDYL